MLLLTYLAAGTIVGILAGLFGIGGGVIIVPMLDFCLTRQGIPSEFIMHLALGTSMASIMFTSVSSFWAHHKRGSVQWSVVHRIVPGILIGTFLGSCFAARMSTGFLKGFFVVFLFYVSLQMLVDRKPRPSRELPGMLGMFGVGNAIGAMSSLLGVGGGVMSVTFMIWCNVAIHQAIGTSAAIGFPIAVSGALGYLYNGMQAADLPPYTAGYIYLPALAGIVLASVLTAPLGVRLAYRLPVSKLKRFFAVFLMVVGIRMLVNLIL
ncbi:MAG TPA: sulfite exporter TauE/SafE family protein [Smithellaceae bacterium]|nr:sulfite exporter TauE/SafE family protein [Smithellaceae bacterium]